MYFEGIGNLIDVPDKLDPKILQFKFSIKASDAFRKNNYHFKLDALGASYSDLRQSKCYREIGLGNNQPSLNMMNTLIRVFGFYGNAKVAVYDSLPIYRQSGHPPDLVKIPDQMIENSMTANFAEYVIKTYSEDTAKWWLEVGKPLANKQAESSKKIRAKQIKDQPLKLQNAIESAIRYSFKLEMTVEQVSLVLNEAFKKAQMPEENIDAERKDSETE